jgi:predicted hotdog family 3-hydroxylacyl-ACP dehydratase
MASPQKIIAAGNDILRYIPQRPPMVMVGRLIGAANKRTVTSLMISDENIFCQDGFLREPGLIENMAQTAAAGAGYLASLENKEPRVGFIGGIRDLRIVELPAVGSVITTEIVVEHEILDASVVRGKITLDEKLIAECELKIFLLSV